MHEYLSYVIDELLKSSRIAYPSQHREELQLNCLTESIKLDSKLSITINNNLILSILQIGMNLIIQSRYFMYFLDCLINNDNSYLIITLIEYLIIIHKIRQT